MCLLYMEQGILSAANATLQTRTRFCGDLQWLNCRRYRDDAHSMTVILSIGRLWYWKPRDQSELSEVTHEPPVIWINVLRQTTVTIWLRTVLNLPALPDTACYERYDIFAML